MTCVFLSYARGDDESFVWRLYRDLTARGFDVWFDRVSMPNRGLAFTDEIRRAIAEHDRFVLVVGPKAMSSQYVRDEWSCALDLDKPVYPVIRLGDVTQLPERLKLYDARLMQRDEDYDREFARLVDQLQADPPRLGALHGVPSLPPHFLERSEDLRRLRDAVTSDLERKIAVTGAAARIGAQGMGGIGKSVLAACMARDTKVRRMFPDGVFWVPLGQDPTLEELQRDVARALSDAADFTTIPMGQKRLRELLRDKQALLVLDDLWQANHAEAFDVLGPHCRMLITTRDASLVTTLGGTHYEVQLLSDSDALRLVGQWAGVEYDLLPSESRQIVAECGRLPLALSICGAMVRDKRSWTDVVTDLKNAELEFLKHDLPNYPHKDVWKAIKIGIDALAAERPEYKDRFAELAVFPTDETVPESVVAVLWSHTGGMKDVRLRDLLRLLASKSLVRLDVDVQAGSDAPARVSTHDLIHDFALRLAGDRKRLHLDLVEAYLARCPDGWHSGPNDGYFFEHLRNHLVAAGRGSELADLLHDLRWLEAKNAAGLVFDLGRDFAAAQTALPDTDDRCRILKLLDEALRRDIHFIARHTNDYPQALFQCLWNLGWWYDCPDAAEHYEPPEGGWTSSAPPPWAQSRPKLYELLETWQKTWQQIRPGEFWLRAQRPPSIHLGTAQQAVFRGHEHWVRSVSYSPEGVRIVSGSSDATVRVWDADSGAELQCLCGHTGGVWSVSYSRDGQRIVSGSGDHTVRVWDAASGLELLCLCGHNDGVTSVSYSPDGMRILSGASDAVRVWNAHTGEELLRLQGHGLRGHEREMKSVAFSPDGTQIISEAEKRTVRIYDANTGMQLACFPGPWTSVACLSFTPDGQRIVIAGREKCLVQLWDLKSETCVLEFYVDVKDNEEDSTTCLAISPDGREIVSGASDHTVRIWDAANGRQLDCLQGHEDQLTSVAFSPDGKWIVSGSMDGTVRMWSRNSVESSLRLREHDDQVSEVVFSADGLWIASRSPDHTVRVWNAANGQPLGCLDGHKRGAWCVAFSPDGQRIVSGEGGENVRIWDWANEKILGCLKGHGFGVRSMSFADDGRRIVVAGKDWTVRVWDVDSCKLLARLQGHKGYVDCVAFSPDDRRVVSGAHDGTIRVWDAESAEELVCFQCHASDVHTVAFSPDGQQIISGDWRGLRVWDAQSGAELAVLGSHDGHLESASYSHDGRRIAGGFFQNSMRVWDATTFACLEVIRGTGDVAAIAAGATMFPWRAMTRSLETVVEDAATGLTIAWFPVALRSISTHPSGRQWAGASGNHLYLIALEDG